MISPPFLKGVIRCENCDTPMIPTCCIKNGMRYRYYTCQKHHRFKNCTSPHKNVPAESVERTVRDEILKIIRSPEVVTNINRLAEKTKEISKSDLMLALKNLKEV